MRLSETTLLILARAGDQQAEDILLWLNGLHERWSGREGYKKYDARPWWERQNKSAEAWTGNGGRIGVGWPGSGGILMSPVNLRFGEGR